MLCVRPAGIVFLLRNGLLEELELRVAQLTKEAEKLRLRTSVREMIFPDGLAGNFQLLVQALHWDQNC